MKVFFTILVISIALFSNAQTFTDVSTSAGLQLKSGSEGIAVGDFNNDGYDDFYVTMTTSKNQLYQNNGDGTFTEVGESLGVALGEDIDSRASVWGDVNNDGWLDLYVGNKSTPDQFFLNNGDGTFQEISFDAGIYQLGNPKSINMADVNNDGFLDIYVSDFVGDNVLYLNNGDLPNGQASLTFINYTYAAGVTDNSKSMGAVFFDYDKDGDADLYLVHDGNEPNILYQNDGSGVFTDVSATSGANTESFGMGVDIADVNNDGWLDIYITNLFKNILLLNNADGTFSNISENANVNDFGMGWGTSFLDFDNDGLEDIYVANDYAFSPYRNVLYKNKGNLMFQKSDETEPICNENSSYGTAILDYNLDGNMDILVANRAVNEGVQLFQNADRQKHWINFKLIGTTSNFNAIGSKIQITDNLGLIHYHEIVAGQSWSSQGSSLAHFGLGDATSINELKIIWTSGLEQSVSINELDKIYTITEGGKVEEGIVYPSLNIPSTENGFDFTIAPNPNDGAFQIGFNVEIAQNCTIALYNSVGQLLYSKNIETHLGKNIIPIELKQQDNQLIMIKISGNDFSKTKKMWLK